jgi:hypothetical protein
MLACPDPALDGPVILFQDVVKVLHRTMSTVLLQSALGFESYDGWRVSGVLVGVDDPRVRTVLSAQGFAEKALGGHGVAPGGKKEVMVAPVESTARYKYTHLPLTRM